MRLPVWMLAVGSLAFLLQARWSLAQVAGPPQIRFTYENPKLQPAKYVLIIGEDGNGHFQSELGSAAPADSTGTAAGPQDRPIHISKALRDEVFATARKNKLFAIPCDSHQKNLAFQGTKTLEYSGPDGSGSCQYNWSKNTQINKLTDELQAVAATLDEGSKLQREYEHGRLSLDMELEFLTQMAQQERAKEIENIAPILERLSHDEAVLQRVQRRAQALLQGAKTD